MEFKIFLYYVVYRFPTVICGEIFYSNMLSLLLDVCVIEHFIGAIFEMLLKPHLYWKFTRDLILNF